MISKSVKITSYIVRFLGVFLILFTLLAIAESIINLSALRDFGVLGVDEEFVKGSDSLLVVTNIRIETPASRSGIAVGDTIVRIGGKFFNRTNFQKAFGDPIVWKKINVSVKRGSIEILYELQYIPATFYEKFIDQLFRVVPVVLMLTYVLVGFWGLLKSPYSKETMIIAMFCFSFGSFMFATINFSNVVDTFVNKYLYFREMKVGVLFLGMQSTSFWLLLFATFPRRLSFFDSNKFLSYFFIFLLPIIFIISVVFSLSIAPYVVFFMFLINMTLGVLLLKSNVKKARNALELRQIRLMFLGIKYGSASIVTGWICVMIGQFVLHAPTPIYEYAGLTIFLLGEIGGLIIPLTFLNSFFQNKLLETESALKRKIRYIGVTTLMLIVYLSIIFLIGQLWISMFAVTDPTVIIILVLLLSLTFTPINKKILKWVDEKFYPEKTKYTESLRQFIQNISSHLESGELLHHLSDWARATTGIYKAIPITADYPAVKNMPFRTGESDSIVNRISDGNKFFWDELGERSRIPVNRYEFEWARDNDISVTIPMLSRGELMGVLNVGRKIHEDDFSAEDLDILTQASGQAAIALQNIKLQSEYIEKKRIDKELDMARSIQKRLMPQIIPDVPGLDVVGECHPCNEIAGDYFDIINIEGNLTVMVVADVSGKGAGAAMIMANLQASIRLGVHLSDKLADFVSRINELIYTNTSSSEFITFFMGIWDPAKHVMYYVNAGHNPPVIIDTGGSVTRLPATGLILGVLPEQEYEEKYIQLKPGSVFAIYTDGLEEALNQNDELYGDERIIDTVKRNMNHDPDEIIQALSDDVLDFCSGRPLHDDVTLIVGKVK